MLNNAMMEINTRKTDIKGKLSPTTGGFRGFMEQVTSEESCDFRVSCQVCKFSKISFP